MSKSHIRRAISRLRERIDIDLDDFRRNGYPGDNETRTRYVLIDPLLRACGWGLSNPREVAVELKPKESGRGRIDYRLNQADGSFIFVEAKTFTDMGMEGTSQRHDLQNTRQLRNYVRGKLEGTAALTDGNIWRIYDLSRRGRFHDKQVEEFIISSDFLYKCTDVAYEWLRRK